MRELHKRAILDAAIARLTADAEALRASARATREGAVHEESRAENDKDTRGLEASYLARGQAMRVEETEEAIARLRALALRDYAPDAPIGLGALVGVDVEGDARLYLLVPAAGGLRVDAGPVEVLLITPASPVGRALVDKRIGDVVEVRTQRALREHEVVSVR